MTNERSSLLSLPSKEEVRQRRVQQQQQRRLQPRDDDDDVVNVNQISPSQSSSIDLLTCNDDENKINYSNHQQQQSSSSRHHSRPMNTMYDEYKRSNNNNNNNNNNNSTIFQSNDNLIDLNFQKSDGVINSIKKMSMNMPKKSILSSDDDKNRRYRCSLEEGEQIEILNSDDEDDDDDDYDYNSSNNNALSQTRSDDAILIPIHQHQEVKGISSSSYGGDDKEYSSPFELEPSSSPLLHFDKNVDDHGGMNIMNNTGGINNTTSRTTTGRYTNNNYTKNYNNIQQQQQQQQQQQNNTINNAKQAISTLFGDTYSDKKPIQIQKTKSLLQGGGDDHTTSNVLPPSTTRKTPSNYLNDSNRSNRIQDLLSDDNSKNYHHHNIIITKNELFNSSGSRSRITKNVSSLLDQAVVNHNNGSNNTNNSNKSIIQETNRIPKSSFQITTSSSSVNQKSNSNLTFRHNSEREQYGNHNKINALSSSKTTTTTTNVTNNTANTNAARSWFGGTLNSTSGSTLPTIIDSKGGTGSTTSSQSSSSSFGNNVHVIGSSNYNKYNQHVGQSFLTKTTITTDESFYNISQQQPPKNNYNHKIINNTHPTSSRINGSLSHWNWLNTALFISYGFTTAANNVPMLLIPTIAMNIFYSNDVQEEEEDGSSSKFAATVATYAVLGTALGKFLNGSLGDIFGARRVMCYFSLLHSFSLLSLSFCFNGWSVILCCVAAEYYQSVQWPCIAVILATHYGKGTTTVHDDDDDGDKSLRGVENREEDNSRGNTDGRYEKGIYVASLGSRAGALIASLSTTMLLRYEGMGWRAVARLASFVSKVMSCHPNNVD